MLAVAQAEGGRGASGEDEGWWRDKRCPTPSPCLPCTCLASLKCALRLPTLRVFCACAQESFPLPADGQRNVLITSALPYVNNVPHLGNLIGCVLSADVYARYCRQRGYRTAFVCGTDEYGTATEAKAREEGLTPRGVCDKYHKIHAEVYDWFDVDFDHFGRTSCPEPRSTPDWPQTVVRCLLRCMDTVCVELRPPYVPCYSRVQITQDIFNKANARGNIVEKVVTQQFCQDCNTFLADRFIEGTCPLCGYKDARGDQCDGCGKLIDATELIEPRCKTDSSHTVSLKSSEHLFLDLPRLSEDLRTWLDKASPLWSKNAVSQTNAWFEGEDGLLPRCITRDLKWGTPVPVAKHANKVFYVWFDAPIGYISITATATPDWKQWWQNPDNVELYQFMGKDNVPFHTIIFPSSLIASGDNWTLLRHLSTTEYVRPANGKQIIEEGGSLTARLWVLCCSSTTRARSSPSPGPLACSAWMRRSLASRLRCGATTSSTLAPRTRTLTSRGATLAVRAVCGGVPRRWRRTNDPCAACHPTERNNNELLKNLGNFVNRVLSLTNKFYDGKVPAVGELSEEETKLQAEVNGRLASYIKELEACNLRQGLRVAMDISAAGNLYLQRTEPWKARKTNPERCATSIACALSLVRVRRMLRVTHVTAGRLLTVCPVPVNHGGGLSLSSSRRCSSLSCPPSRTRCTTS